ncbi:hypothetical protein C8R44DRAFT_894527 [Mycena epipterygia]|nr:hypothetical protein C8R44DRAFT_894527 [Mycena epipterygia]
MTNFPPSAAFSCPPTLVNIRVVLRDCTPDLSLLSTLRLSHPRLTDIHIYVPASSSSVRVVSSAIYGWNFIKNLTLVTLDELGLALVASPQTSNSIHIVFDTLQSAFSLVASISSVQLEDIQITTLQCAPSSAWKKAFLCLERLPSCGHLSALYLSQRINNPVHFLNSDTLPTPSRPPARRRRTLPAHSLAYLHTGPSPITSPALVSAFLSNSFAHIAFGLRPDDDAADRPWNEVARLLEMLHAVRAAEARC